MILKDLKKTIGTLDYNILLENWTCLCFKTPIIKWFEFYPLTRKASGFKSLRLNFWDINQATSKCQSDFWTKLAKESKIEKMNITIKFCIFKLVYLGTKFCLNLSLEFLDQINTKSVFPK